MANKSFKDIFGEVLNTNHPGSGFSGKKLNEADLDNVTGGVITWGQEKLLKMAVSTAKNTYNCTFDEVMNGIPEYYEQYCSQYTNVTMDDVTTWITNNWDRI